MKTEPEPSDFSRDDILELAERAEANLARRHGFAPTRPLSLNPVFLFLFSRAFDKKVGPTSRQGLALMRSDFLKDLCVETPLEPHDALHGAKGYLLLRRKEDLFQSAARTAGLAALCFGLFKVAASIAQGTFAAGFRDFLTSMTMAGSWLSHPANVWNAALFLGTNGLLLWGLGRLWKDTLAMRRASSLAGEHFGKQSLGEMAGRFGVEATKILLTVAACMAATVLCAVLAGLLGPVFGAIGLEKADRQVAMVVWGAFGGLWGFVFAAAHALNPLYEAAQGEAAFLDRVGRWRGEEPARKPLFPKPTEARRDWKRKPPSTPRLPGDGAPGKDQPRRQSPSFLTP